jgi:endonuclease-8
MPEGDTIFRAARTLNRALAGRRVVRFESVLPALTRIHEDTPVTGRTVESVTAAGKHVLMRFSPLDVARGDHEPVEWSGRLVLRTHMRMNGSWHIYRTGERWRRPRRDMRVVVATDAFEAVGFNVPVAEFLFLAGASPRTPARSLAGAPTPRAAPSPAVPSLERQEDLRKMGPDLLGETFDADEAVRRFRERPAVEIADALLNQRVVAGVGNVYKSEMLFLCGIDPFARVDRVSDDQLRAILETARKHMKANVIDPTAAIVTYRGYRRTTGRADPSERLYVYGRARKPCRKCGTRIDVRAQGPNARLTYWCPVCQA